MRRGFFLRYGLLIVAIAVSGGLLLHTSQSVQRAESNLHDLRAAIEREDQTIDVLRAEWAFLNSPYRLERLAVQYLGMVPSEASYIVPDLNVLMENEGAVLGNAVVPHRQGQAIKPEMPANGGLQHVSNAPARKPVPPVQAEKPLNGAGEKGFDDLMNRLGGGR